MVHSEVTVASASGVELGSSGEAVMDGTEVDSSEVVVVELLVYVASTAGEEDAAAVDLASM